MADYRAMYYLLFQAATDAVERLQQAQRQAEEMYLQDDGAELVPLPEDPGETGEHESQP